MTLYDDLGVSPDATPEEIIAAYRRAAKAHHPDAGGDPEQFARIQRAADVLRDADKRAHYDATGSADEPPINAQAEAANVLCDVFRQVRQQFRNALHQVDLSRKMIAGIEQLQQNVALERNRLQDEKRDNESSLMRLRHRGKGGDFIRTMLEDEATKLDRGLAMLDYRDRVMEAALAMAREYDWVVDIDDLEMVLLPGSPGSSATIAHMRRR